MPFTASAINNLSGYNTPSDDIAAAAAFASDGTNVGATVTPTKADEQLMIELSNVHETDAKNVTIVAGDSYAPAVEDLTVSLAAGEVKMIALESALFLQTTGTYKGKYVFKGTTDNKIRAFQMP